MPSDPIHARRDCGRPRLPSRGSILIVAMIFSAIIAIALTTYLKLATTALNLSQRSFLANDTMNLTESGLEQALWNVNEATAGRTAWGTGWTTNTATSPHTATATFTSGFSLSQGATGSVKVYVENYDSGGSPAPLIVAKGIVQPAQGAASIIKMVRVNLLRRSLFSNGMVGRNGLSFSGNNASVDSWNSDPDNNSATAAIPYSAAVKHDSGTIAAVNISATIGVQNADIWGYASVGSTDTAAIQVGSQGVVGPFGTASGTKDPSHVAANFTANLPNAVAPTASTVNTISSTIGNSDLPMTLPRVGDVAASDGKYYYSLPGIGVTGSSSNVLTIGAHDVVLLPTAGAGTTAISMGGSSSIAITAGGSLAVYTAGNIDIAGNGLLNANTQPITAQFWGTGTTAGGQSIAIKGNGALSAVVYAPNANVTINGNGDVMGAIVGYTDSLTGNAAFHYDESLANWGANNPFQISKWRELVSSTDRALYSMSF